MKMAQALQRVGHEVALFAWAGAGTTGDAFAEYGVAPTFRLERVRPFPLPAGGRLAMAFSVWRDLRRRGRPDVLYARNLSGLAAAARCDAPAFYEAHTPPGSQREGRVAASLFGRRNFGGLVVISEALRAEYEQRYPSLRGRILVAPDGADILHPVPPPPNGVAAERLQVGYIGQLYPGKGMEMIVRLAGRCPEMDFHVVGGSPEEIASWQTRLRANNPSGNVSFHGHVPHGELADHIHRHHVLIAPYQEAVSGVGGGRDLARWMSPLKIFEYMAARRPIVCSDLPVLREILSHQVNALLVRPDDIDAWAAALRRLAADGELQGRLAAAAYRDLEANYTWERRARRISDFVKGAVAAPPAARRDMA